MELAGEIRDEFLTCNICLEEYQRPKQLPCLHTFCRSCLSRYIAQTVGSSGKLSVPCPLCRRVAVPRDPDIRKLHEWADQFPDNFFVASLRETLEARKSRSSTGSSPAPAGRESLGDGDQTQASTMRFLGETKSCHKHLTHRMTRYCLTLKTGVCELCLEEREHAGCEPSQHLDTEAARLKATELFQTYRQDMTQVKDEVQQVKEVFGRKPRRLRLVKEEVEIAVGEHFADLRARCAKLLLKKEREATETLAKVLDEEVERSGSSQKECDDISTSVDSTMNLFDALTRTGPFNAMHVLNTVEEQIDNFGRLTAKLEQESRAVGLQFQPPQRSLEEHLAHLDLGKVVSDSGSGEMAVVDSPREEGRQAGASAGDVRRLETRLSRLQLSEPAPPGATGTSSSDTRRGGPSPPQPSASSASINDARRGGLSPPQPGATSTSSTSINDARRGGLSPPQPGATSTSSTSINDARRGGLSPPQPGATSTSSNDTRRGGSPLTNNFSSSPAVSENLPSPGGSTTTTTTTNTNIIHPPPHSNVNLPWGPTTNNIHPLPHSNVVNLPRGTTTDTNIHPPAYSNVVNLPPAPLIPSSPPLDASAPPAYVEDPPMGRHLTPLSTPPPPHPSAPPVFCPSPSSPCAGFGDLSTARAAAWEQSQRKEMQCSPVMVFSGNLPTEARRGGLVGAAKLSQVNRAAFVDRHNHSVKIIDLHMAKVVGYLHLGNLEPWDITFIATTEELVVTCPDSKCIIFIPTDKEHLEITHHLNTKVGYCCIAHLKDEQIAGGVCAPYGRPEVNVFSCVTGAILWKIEEPGSFHYPRTIFSDPTGHLIVVSDWTSNVVVVATSEGRLVRRYREAPNPKGVAISESSGLLHVLDGKWGRLHLLDHQGVCVGMAKVEGCRDPRMVVVVPTRSIYLPDSELTVVADGNNALHVMRLHAAVQSSGNDFDTVSSAV